MPDPFGLKAGSTPPSGMVNYMLAFHTVPKPHPSFQSYSGIWTPEGGLVRVTAYSKTFTDEADCRSARALYEQIKRQLTQVYGPTELIEFVDHDATWSDEEDFWQALNSNERTHGCQWEKDAGARLDAGIVRINLLVVSNDDYDTSQVVLAYEFEGFSRPEVSDEYGLDSL